MSDRRPAKENIQRENPNLHTQPQLTTLRPIFLYGTLMSSRLLAEVLTGDEKKTMTVERRRMPVTLQGYSRHAVVDANFPAIIKGKSTDKVEGFLYFHRSIYDEKRFNDFASDSYRREEVEVVDRNKKIIESYAYVWCDDLNDLKESDWSFDEFESNWFR